MSDSANGQVVVVGQKRGPGRPPKSGLAPNKKQKRQNNTDELSLTHDVAHDDTPPPEKKRGLPTRVTDAKPLPTLPESQSLTLSDADYASIATSGVLARSLDRSRRSWTQTGVFERYWTKPETGKNARPPPPNNPDVKSMKSRGRCRLRIEPHIFEVEIYVVERPRPPPPKQYLPPKPTVVQPWQSQPYQPATNTTNTQPIAPQIPSAQDIKPGPDPVIGLLATRAGSDPELKALMREVAAGNAPPEQLKIFQKHIDELNAVLRQQKATEEPQASLPVIHDAQMQQFPQATSPYVQPQKYVPPQPPLPGEVVFAFTAPGATSDRFLFPQNCILETLTPQHLLTSFIIVKKGEDASNSADFDPSTEYWSPVTIMVEVAYGREGILKDIQRWVKSPDESREHMTMLMEKYKKIPNTYLALRLPLKGTEPASMNTSKTSTPVPQPIDDKRRRQPKDTAVVKKRKSLAKEVLTSLKSEAMGQAVLNGNTSDVTDTAVNLEVDVTTETNQRPVRATRKSVRMNEI